MSSEFSDLSVRMTKALTLDTKKDQGIYFTPYSTVKQILDCVSSVPEFSFTSVLEPACGTGQFLEPMERAVPGIKITAVEFNPDIYREVSVGRPCTTNVISGDFLKVDFGMRKFDLIIGNPPYFVVPKTTVSRVYAPYVTGRPNIYILFILKSLELLNDNGILAFVLPNNFLNCHYYDKLRQLIFTDFTIIDILPQKSASYVDTEQNTCVMIIQKKHPSPSPSPSLNEKFKVRLQKCAEFTIFNTPDLVHKINELLKGTTTLAALGFDVKVGNVVWNQCKDILTDNEADTRLIYSRDIGDNGALNLHLTSGDPTKKNYIRKAGTKATMLLVNRGYGKGKYVFKYCLIDNPSFSYLVENHVTCIYRSDEATTSTAAAAGFQVIINSFNDSRTLEFVNLYFENNAINTTELKHILPIWTH
jgi:adenine-specific DNA-methyltransferase